MGMKAKEPPPGGRGRNPMSFIGLGIEMALPLVLFIYVGHWLDERYETDPWLLLVGALLGIVVGFYNLFRGLLNAVPRNVPPKHDPDGRDG